MPTQVSSMIKDTGQQLKSVYVSTDMLCQELSMVPIAEQKQTWNNQRQLSTKECVCSGHQMCFTVSHTYTTLKFYDLWLCFLRRLGSSL